MANGERIVRLDTTLDNFDTQESVISSKPVRRSWGCCACLIGCGCAPPLMILILVILNLLYQLLFGKIVNIENDSIPNIMQELAGEWVVEKPGFFPIGGERGMENWQDTKLILKEDGTCELHNVTSYMTSPFMYQWRPELMRKTLIGTWESIPRHVSYSDGTEKVYVVIRVRVYATEEHLIEQAEKSYVEPKDRPPFEDEFAISLGLTTEWQHEVAANLGLGKVSGGFFRGSDNEKDYRLYWLPPDPDMGIGPVLKRVLP